MVTNRKRQYKDPQWVIAWLRIALRPEQRKYEQCPVLPDLVPGHESTQAWGYVVAV